MRTALREDDAGGRARAVFAVVACMTMLLAGGAPASAKAPTRAGWWTSAATPAAGPGVTTPNPIAAGVGEDQLLVQGGPSMDSPVAYAAVAFVLTPDEHPGELTLVAATGSILTPATAIKACPLTQAVFAPSQGGASSAGPKFDCTNGAASKVSSDLKSVSFDLSRLQSGATVAVAIVPSTVERVIFAKPDDSALAASTGSTPASAVAGPYDGAPSPTSVNEGPVTVTPGTPGTGDRSPAPSVASGGSQPAATETRLPVRSSAISLLAALIAVVVAFGAWTLSRRLAHTRDKIADVVPVDSQIATA